MTTEQMDECPPSKDNHPLSKEQKQMLKNIQQGLPKEAPAEDCQHDFRPNATNGFICAKCGIIKPQEDWHAKYTALEKSWKRNNEELAKAQEWEAKYHAEHKTVLNQNETIHTYQHKLEQKKNIINYLEQWLERVLADE